MYNLLAIDIVYILAAKRGLGQGAKTAEIADALGVSRTTVWRYMSSMMDEGIVTQRGAYYFMDAASTLVRAFVNASEKFNEEHMSRHG